MTRAVLWLLKGPDTSFLRFPDALNLILRPLPVDSYSDQ